MTAIDGLPPDLADIADALRRLSPNLTGTGLKAFGDADPLALTIPDPTPEEERWRTLGSTPRFASSSNCPGKAAFNPDIGFKIPATSSRDRPRRGLQDSSALAMSGWAPTP